MLLALYANFKVDTVSSQELLWEEQVTIRDVL